ncbi:Methionine--tRNA ligase [Candidatus Sulfotelmatobacter kueseliae]|uniref:Methionine--tRNA ligase n=1 Tax=Candidatus Sulfotelmatobacter kueseliae TaxID=2042962 RepID=A0A2U3KIJ5_9BACT|nr:Methionine--tRNA ligase [Candidatus Sulfotelmatobacter kueseliae]
MTRKFYITTPIYYVNAHPHIGHAYTTIACDTVARRQRMLGADTFFLTGTDEHGQKIERAAQAAGKTPQQFTDEVAGEFRALWQRMGISNDDFIRTTEDRHKKRVQELFRRIRDKGFIYKGRYTGQYCFSDELYVDSAKPGDPCPICGRPTETVEEENYFFKLSAFQDQLLELYTNPEFIRPETRRNEVISFVRSGLRDLSISRSTFSWGIPVPDDPKHVIYVWLDALANYITAIGFGSTHAGAQEAFQKYWPADVHMIGKEIVRFHCVYWPAFLLAAELPLPRAIMAHGWLLFEESKMSKSRGNIVRAETILDVLGADALRYFLLREVVFGQDGSFSFDALVQRYNSDLANGLGNLASRTLTMINRYFKGEVPYPSHAAAKTAADDAIAEAARKTIREFATLFDQFQFSRALESAWSLVAAVDKYIVENEPWSLGEKQDEDSRARLATVLYTSAEALRIATALAHPVIPDATAKIWAQMGLGDIKKLALADLAWGQLHLGTKLGAVQPVFPRADKSAVERMQQMEDQQRGSAVEEAKLPAAQPSVAPAAQPAAATPASPSLDAGKITIDDFAKVDLRVGIVKVAERVPKADKLLRLEIDIGTEVRQVVAGIAEAYAPETLIGRKVVIVANLAPRKLRGLESNGMIVAASPEGGKPVLTGFLEDVPIGARLK